MVVISKNLPKNYEFLLLSNASCFYRSQNVFWLVQIFVQVSKIDLHIVLVPNFSAANQKVVCQYKQFWSSTKCNSIFGQAQNISGPVEGKGINQYSL